MSLRDMSTLKRVIAVAGGSAALVMLLVVMGVISFTVRQTGDGADPDAAFSPTEMDDAALRASTTWSDDPPGLVRTLDSTTRDRLADAWLRADQALALAADGDPAGLPVWYTGPALDQARQRFATPGAPAASGATQVTTLDAVRHELGVEFVSADAQIVVLSIDTTALAAVVTDAPTTDDATVDTVGVRSVEVIMVLSDGTWRIRNIEAR